jgi:predicted regulator of Ras-like GTPase activity (Roadblock/LC7/MglB family)
VAGDYNSERGAEKAGHLPHLKIVVHPSVYFVLQSKKALFLLSGDRVVAKSRTEQLVERLRDLQASSGDVEGAAIVSVDGLSMGSALASNIEEDRVSAMSAAMLSLGERISAELGRGNLEQVYVKGENGYVILTAVGEEAVLTVLARREAKLGLIFLDVARTVEDLAKLV